MTADRRGLPDADGPQLPEVDAVDVWVASVAASHGLCLTCLGLRSFHGINGNTCAAVTTAVAVEVARRYVALDQLHALAEAPS